MIVKILRNETFNNPQNVPVTATEKSTGYDICATSDPEIIGTIASEMIIDGQPTKIYSSVNYIQYKTDIFIQFNKTPNNFIYDTLIFPRSSISKYNLQLANSIGLCDNDYIGEYLIRFNYVWQPEDYMFLPELNKVGGIINTNKIYNKGDKICQLKFSMVIHPTFVLTDTLTQTDRGSGGFGSTDNPVRPTPAMAYTSQVDITSAYATQKPENTKIKYTDIMEQLARNNNPRRTE